jgi:hypothetical protein
LETGDRRRLDFQITRRKRSGEYGHRFFILADKNARKDFQLSNGSLFFMCPDDKQDQLRLAFVKKSYIFKN